MSDDNKKRLAEIKARAEAATKNLWDCEGDVPTIVREDVPFLLEQLEQAAEELRVERIKREATADVFMKRLKAAESAAGQMRAALEETRLGEDKEDHLPCWCHSPSYAKARRLRGEPNDGHVEACVRNRAALATDAGKGWLSPEEAERLQQTHRITQATLSATLEEAERLRKEIAEWKRRNEILVAKSRLDVTEEESARRCREVAEILLLKCHVCGKPATCVGRYDNMEDGEPACDECCGHGCEDGRCFPLYLEGPLNLDAIIERVAKGKS